MRRLHEYPPFSDLFTLIVSGADESRVLRASALLRDAMRAALQKDSAYAGEHIQIVGPAPAPVHTKSTTAIDTICIWSRKTIKPCAASLPITSKLSAPAGRTAP